ncbi:hypothetical protein A0H81_06983 [Grifola frondosa]|uniref:Uncharacterized protein n=1 Tax=Grifola frondosa TaxID=5627 RepID=A0A1C7M988_GRIFR|nr:hypothetical protein A0H81_06983 [Grifola frondosa]
MIRTTQALLHKSHLYNTLTQFNITQKNTMQQINIKRFSLTALLRRSFKRRSADPAEDSTSLSPSFGREPVTQSSPTPSFASVSDWESVVQPSLCLSLSFEDSSEVSCTPWFQGTTSTDDDVGFAPAQVHEVSRGSLTKEMSIAEMYSAYLKGEAIDKNEVYPCFASVIPTFGESIGMGSEIAKEPPCADTPATFKSDEPANEGTVRRTMIGDEADNGSIVAEQNNVVAFQIDATEVQVEINDVSASVLAEELEVKFGTRIDSGESEVYVKEKIQARDVHTMKRAEIYLPEGKNGKKKWLAAAPEDEIERTEDLSQTVSTKEFIERIEIVNEVRTGGRGLVKE